MLQQTTPESQSNLVEKLIQKIKHHLITSFGRTAKEATNDEYFQALSSALREEIAINWIATNQTQQKQNGRKLYYLSMEYLPGRMISNNLTNIRAFEIVQEVIKRMDRPLERIINREHDAGLGNGGLGRLASCFLDSLATQHFPAMGYGLRYHYGVFEQQIWDGVQVECPDSWLFKKNPWETRQDRLRVAVKFGGLVKPSDSDGNGGKFQLDLEDCDEVRALPYDMPIIGYGPQADFSVVTLRLWTTKESPRNFQVQRYNAGLLGQASENTSLTDILYPDDSHDTGRRIRLKQEFLLVSASLQDIISHYLLEHQNFDNFADKVRIQINDTHPALVIAELMRLLIKRHGLSWTQAWEITQEVCGYTNHTILREALEEWDVNLFGYLLPRQLHIIEKLNHQFCQEIRSRYPDDEARVQRMSIIEYGKVRMAPLSIVGSHRVNGVAQLHSKIIKENLFRDFAEFYPDRFINVTNGVTQRRWLLDCNPELSKLITERIGDQWITNFEEISKLSVFADDEQTLEEFLAIKLRNKKRLVDFLATENQPRSSKGKLEGAPPLLNPCSLFDVQVKRIHEYKRQLLNALHLIMLYRELQRNPESRSIERTVLVSGKAAHGYEMAKAIIRLFHCIARTVNNDPTVQGKLRVLFIENYSVSRAELIIPATDLSEQISTAGLEASGTGNMKLTINGALTIGTDDGANIEMRREVGNEWWPFKFGCSSEEIQDFQTSQSYNPCDIYAGNNTIREAVDTLRDGSLTENEAEHQTLSSLYYSLIEGFQGQPADKYFVLQDLKSYYDTQKNVEELFAKPMEWAQYAIHNIAGMGAFSSDNSIKTYNEQVWGLTPCPPNPEILKEVYRTFAEHDKCRVLPKP